MYYTYILYYTYICPPSNAHALPSHCREGALEARRDTLEQRRQQRRQGDVEGEQQGMGGVGLLVGAAAKNKAGRRPCLQAGCDTLVCVYLLLLLFIWYECPRERTQRYYLCQRQCSVLQHVGPSEGGDQGLQGKGPGALDDEHSVQDDMPKVG